MSRKKQGDHFPGHFTDMMNRLNQSGAVDKNYKSYQMPNSMVLFARDDLVNLMEKNGMISTHSYSFTIPTAENPHWEICEDTKSSIAGVIAIKRE